MTMTHALFAVVLLALGLMAWLALVPWEVPRP